MLGARVALAGIGPPTVWRRAHTDGSYLSAHDPRVLFGLGPEPTEPLAVHVRWPAGTTEQWADLAPGRYHILVEGRGRAVGTP
jgi:hypothetical protein